MKKVLFSMTLLLSVSFAFGQTMTKEELKERKRQIKSLLVVAKDAESIILDDPATALKNVSVCLESPLVNNDPYVWYVSAKARKNIIEKENASRVQGAQIDMNKFYSYCATLINELETCDSLDNLPNEKGVAKPQYTEFIKTTLYENRNQMYNGGSHYYNEGNYSESFNQFAKFIDLSEHKYLKENMQEIEKAFNVGAAYNAVLCGMRLEDYGKVLQYADYALADSTKAKNIYRYKAQAYYELGDTAKWIDLLKEAVVKYPDNPYFYQSLIQYYDNAGNIDALNSLADELMAASSTEPLFVYLKGYIAHQQNDTDSAAEWYKKTLEVDPEYLNALTNLGRIYTNKAQEYAEKQATTKFDRAQIKKDKEILDGYFNEALPYFEKVRTLAPDRTDLWMQGLTNCYYNLNMEDKLKEIEEIAAQK